MGINSYRSKKILTTVLLFVVLAIGFNNCGQPGQIMMTTTSASQSVFDICGSNKSCDPYQYVVKKNNYVVETRNKVDILIVIDNSGSMAYEQKNMAQRFSGFIQQIDSYGLDWRLAIITTDVAADADLKDGRLVNFRGADMALIPNLFWLSKTNTNSLAQATDLFAATIQRKVGEGSGNEQGIKATYRFLERAETSADINSGFLRSDATLSVIVATDDDESPTDKANPTFEDRNQPKKLMDFVKSSLGPMKSFSFSSIIVKPGDTACYDYLKRNDDGTIYKNSSGNTERDNEDYGNKYAELTQLSGGILGSVCEADYAQQLKVVGNKVIEQVKEINLECAPVDANSDGKPDLTVKHEEAGGWVLFGSQGYVLQANRFTFNNYAAEGGWEFTYTCKK